MDDSTGPPSTADLTDILAEGRDGEAVARLEDLATAAPEDRKATTRALRSLADDSPGAFEAACPALAGFLDDENRAVRLSTAKLFVAVADGAPEAVRPVVPALADRLADDDEFYYVRARAAEALGYVALDHPDAVASPEILADLRVGLSFDEPEVKEKLAKALEYVAFGDPGRLDHQAARLADHLDDESELVRYHLCTALAVVGCESPEKLAAVTAELGARLDDENPHVRGRAAEAFRVLARADAVDASLPEEDLERLAADGDAFVAERAAFALGEGADDESADRSTDLGTVEGIRGTTDDAVDDITSPDADGECPHCGLELPPEGPPMCPRCGAPY